MPIKSKINLARRFKTPQNMRHLLEIKCKTFAVFSTIKTFLNAKQSLIWAVVEWDLVVRKVFLIDLFRLTNQSEGSGGVGGGRGVSATRVGSTR